MSQTDKAVRARIAGKVATAARVVWQLEVGQLRARCVRVGNAYAVMGRRENGWTDFIGGGPDPVALLRKVSASVGVATAVRARIEAT